MFKSSRNMLLYAHRNEPYRKGQLSAKKIFGSHGQFTCAGLFRVKKSEKIKFLARHMFKSSRHMLVYAHRNEPYSEGQLFANKFFGSHGQFTCAGLLGVKKSEKIKFLARHMFKSSLMRAFSNLKCDISHIFCNSM